MGQPALTLSTSRRGSTTTAAPLIQDLGPLLTIDQAIAQLPEALRHEREWFLEHVTPLVKIGKKRGIFQKDWDRWLRDQRADDPSSDT